MDEAVQLLLLILLACTQSTDGHGDKVKMANVFYSAEKGLRIVPNHLDTSHPDSVAWGTYKNQINQTGWSFLEVSTADHFPDHLQAFAAGYAEGYLTSKVLYMHWQNTVQQYCVGESKQKICEKVKEYLRDNWAWVKKKIQIHRKKNPYWHQVALFYEQYEGLVQGYKDADRGQNPIPDGDIFWINIFGDLLDFEQMFAAQLNVSSSLPKGFGSCSALLKILPGNKDILASHVSWYYYAAMLRIQKKYHFGYHWTAGNKRRLIPGNKVSFSSYPGLLFSGDDFHMLSSGLATIETSLPNFNTKLWDLVKPKGSLLEGIRVTVANRLAITGKQWVKIFARRNGGTYNNQWMVLDYKKFRPDRPLPKKDLLHVLEQMPGHVHTEDVTQVMTAKSYWASYNAAYFQDIYNVSGGPELEGQFGTFFNYERAPRALIFKREQRSVVDVASMTRVMRFNQYKTDPLSICERCNPKPNAAFAISDRGDLNDPNGTYPFPLFGHNMMGGTDMKLTTYEMFKKQEMVVIGGPTYDDVPPFQWSKLSPEDQKVPHFGHPDLWKFKPVRHEWQMP